MSLKQRKRLLEDGIYETIQLGNTWKVLLNTREIIRLACLTYVHTFQ